MVDRASGGTSRRDDPHVTPARRLPNTPRRRLVRMSGADFVPVDAILQRPTPRGGTILRGELVDVLRESMDTPVVTVVGPPGYGKTTLVVQWDIEDRRPFAWLSLDPSAGGPVALVTYLIIALQRMADIDVDVGVMGALADESQLRTVLLPRLGRMLTRQRRPFVLVIDNVDHLSDPRTADVLMTIVEHLDEDSQLVLVGRTLPSLAWGRLRAQRQLLAIGPDQLRLSPAETQAVLTAAGVSAAPDTAAEIHQRAEGWPAGVYLAALTLHPTSDQPRDVSAFPGGGTLIADYLQQRVLGRLSADDRQFLVRTSILNTLSGALCDATLDTTGSGERLRRLQASSLFVVPVEGQEQRYRYHELFRAMLVSELASESPRTVRLLHSRASRWLEAAGEIDEAIHHAQSADEITRASQLVWSQAGALYARGRMATLNRWLDGFSNEQVANLPKLSMTAAWCAFEAGKDVDHWIHAAEQGMFDLSKPGESAAIGAGVALLNAQRSRGGVAQLRADAEAASRLLATEDPWRALALYLRAVAELLVCHRVAARKAFVATERLSADLQLPRPQALCLAQLSVMALEVGDWDQAAVLAGRASQLVTDHEIGDSPTVSIVHCAMSATLAKSGRTVEARQLIRRCMRMIAVQNQCPAWLGAEARYLLGRAHLLMGDTAAARILFSEAHARLREVADATWLRDQLDKAWTHVEQFPLATGVGPSALTSAELRVLQLLPTHLSFEEIGKDLGISRNTVKTQAIATYRKLGVSSRSQSVARARALGIIQA